MPDVKLPPEADVPGSPPQAVAVVETDTYCDRCGYNLRTQPVWRDERLGVLVCRCPECGSHRAAGLATVGSLWGRRLASAMLLVWIVLCVGGVATATILTGALQYEAAGVLTYFDLESRDGVQLRNHNAQGAPSLYAPSTLNIGFSRGRNGQLKAYDMVSQAEFDINGPPFVPPSEVVVRYHRPDWLTGRTGYTRSQGRSSPDWESATVYGCVVAGLSLLFGLIMACVCWHWPGRRWAWALLPVLVLSVSLTLNRPSPRLYMQVTTTDREYFIDQAILAAAVWQALWTAVGLWIGRPIVRVLIRMFLPRLARVPLSFLWQADNKPLPRTVV